MAQVHDLADVARAERLDHAKEHAAEHRARKVADAAEHSGGKRLHAEQRAHGVVRDAVVSPDHDTGNRTEPAPITKVAEITRLTLMPISPATCGFSEVARMATPRRVRYTSSVRPAIIRNETDDDRDLHRADDAHRANSNTGLPMICGKPSGLRLQMIIATCCRMIEMPIAVISGASRGAPRSGR